MISYLVTTVARKKYHPHCKLLANFGFSRSCSHRGVFEPHWNAPPVSRPDMCAPWKWSNIMSKDSWQKVPTWGYISMTYLVAKFPTPDFSHGKKSSNNSTLWFCLLGLAHVMSVKTFLSLKPQVHFPPSMEKHATLDSWLKMNQLDNAYSVG